MASKPARERGWGEGITLHAVAGSPLALEWPYRWELLQRFRHSEPRNLLKVGRDSSARNDGRDTLRAA
jgi:hypothetical protein